MGPPDLGNRDPNNLNDHVRAEFEEVFGEPDGTHAIDCVWKLSYSCYNCGKNCCYKILTILCGVLLALFWGCDFGCTAFTHIWHCTPSLRMYSIWCGLCQKFLAITVSCFLVPVCEACGTCLSQIKVRKGNI